MKLHRVLFTIFIILVFFSCTQKNITEVTVQDTNQDSVYTITPQSGLLGNVSLFLIPETLQGSAIVILNGPGSPIGYDIRDLDEPSIIYFGDSYVSAGGSALQSGTMLPLNRWIKVRLVLYKSGLAGWVVSFLQYLGLDFFQSLEDYMVDAVYEIEVFLVDDKGEVKMKWTEWENKKNFLNIIE